MMKLAFYHSAIVLYIKEKNLNIASAYPQLEAVATYLRAEIWVVNRNGTIVVDSNHSFRVGRPSTGLTLPLTVISPTVSVLIMNALLRM